MRLVCFDTQIVIWGIRRVATPGQEGMIPRAEYLIKKCADDNDDIIIPAIVMGELLCGIPPGNHNSFVDLMRKRFIVPPFDAQAAATFAKIYNGSRQLQTGAVHEYTRAKMKADCLIVATAVARNAWCIYTEDSGLARIAEGHIDVKLLSSIALPPEQRSLFE